MSLFDKIFETTCMFIGVVVFTSFFTIVINSCIWAITGVSILTKYVHPFFGVK